MAAPGAPPPRGSLAGGAARSAAGARSCGGGAAALGAAAPAGGGEQAALTPRRCVKELRAALLQLDRQRGALPGEVRRAAAALDALVKAAEAARSDDAAGKLHLWLLEDLELQRLAAAAAALRELAEGTASLSRYAPPGYQADVTDAVARLAAAARCALPPSQLAAIQELRALAAGVDPAAAPPDGACRAAEALLRRAVAEVLAHELAHLERAAARLDPATQRVEAATAKLLAAGLLAMDCEAQQGEDDEALGSGGGGDPLFSMPCQGIDQCFEQLRTSVAGAPLAGAQLPQLVPPQLAPQPPSVLAGEQEPCREPGGDLQGFVAALHGSDGRRACSFSAQTQLPAGGLEQLVALLGSSGGRVRVLSLAHHPNGPAGAARLCAALAAAPPRSSLRRLELHDCGLGDDGAALLAGALASGGAAQLRTLGLAANGIGDAGATALAQAVAKHSCLEALSIHNNSIGAAGVAALAAAVAACPALRHVDFLPGNAPAPRRNVKLLAASVRANRRCAG
ncbi:RanGAP [Scenedesmus sp. PABB004]|nr:RanGAP [Scenedesmus sp. PABB004]